MIRVLYRWRISTGREQAFGQAWSTVTRIVQATIKGARGSVLLRDHGEPSQFVAVARWDTLADWQAFHDNHQTILPDAREAIRVMKEASVGGRASCVIFDEIDEY